MSQLDCTNLNRTLHFNVLHYPFTQVRHPSRHMSHTLRAQSSKPLKTHQFNQRRSPKHQNNPSRINNHHNDSVGGDSAHLVGPAESPPPSPGRCQRRTPHAGKQILALVFVLRIEEDLVGGVTGADVVVPRLVSAAAVAAAEVY